MRRISGRCGGAGVILVMGLLATATVARGQAVPPPSPQTVRLLTVGNSFSQNATRYLEDVVKAQGDALIHHPAPISGGTLQQHCEKAAAHAENPDDPQGLYAGSKLSLVQELAAEPWDYITIQQASLRSHDVETYRPFAERLVEILKQGAPEARILVHETWAYRVDDPRFDARFEPTFEPRPGDPADQEAMYQGLSSAYRTIARELNASLIPVGDAFHLADADPEYGYKSDREFDFDAAVHPALPDQTHSLHMGWKWTKKADESYQMTVDGRHANVAGQYLGALVFYESLYGKSCVGCSFRPNGINAEYARFLQETAHKAVAALRGTEFEVKPPTAAPAPAEVKAAAR